jgi:hypothetical protein
LEYILQSLLVVIIVKITLGNTIIIFGISIDSEQIYQFQSFWVEFSEYSGFWYPGIPVLGVCSFSGDEKWNIKVSGKNREGGGSSS